MTCLFPRYWLKVISPSLTEGSVKSGATSPTSAGMTFSFSKWLITPTAAYLTEVDEESKSFNVLERGSRHFAVPATRTPVLLFPEGRAPGEQNMCVRTHACAERRGPWQRQRQ